MHLHPNTDEEVLMTNQCVSMVLSKIKENVWEELLQETNVKILKCDYEISSIKNELEDRNFREKFQNGKAQKLLLTLLNNLLNGIEVITNI